MPKVWPPLRRVTWPEERIQGSGELELAFVGRHLGSLQDYSAAKTKIVLIEGIAEEKVAWSVGPAPVDGRFITHFTLVESKDDPSPPLISRASIAAPFSSDAINTAFFVRYPRHFRG
ncbi:hypothetical protein KM043_006007 [Ampulex compressa]|nr:hypothetical protein KM043_006007 [Ampulex compressa]